MNIVIITVQTFETKVMVEKTKICAKMKGVYDYGVKGEGGHSRYGGCMFSREVL